MLERSTRGQVRCNSWSEREVRVAEPLGNEINLSAEQKHYYFASKSRLRERRRQKSKGSSI